VSYVVFLLHWWSISVWLVLMAFLLRRRGLLRPTDAPIFSWENWLYSLTRWPFIAWGIGSAVRYRLRPRAVTFKVTPKGSGGLEVFPLRLILPYAVISVGSSCAALVGEAKPETAGYAFLSILTGTTYALVSVAVPALHAGEAAAGAGVTRRTALWRTARGPLLLGLILFIPVGLAIAHYPAYVLASFLKTPHDTALWKWLAMLKRRI